MMNSSGAQPTSAVPFERHPTLYFKSGDIVLSAPTVSEKVSGQLFRVHRFMLAHHSPVFADMFDVPPPPDEEGYDGVPLVQMADAAEDFASLLSVLYNPSELPYKRLDPNTPALITGMLRLTAKYQLDDLHARLLDHFSADWPCTVDAWEQVEAEIAAAQRARQNCILNLGQVNLPFIDDCFPEPALAIRLACDFGCPAILPTAFYRIARTPATLDWDACRAEGADRKVLARGAMTVRWALLTHDDSMRVMRGREYLQDEIDRIRKEMLGVPMSQKTADGCSHRDMCYRVRSSIRDHVLGKEDRYDPISALKKCMENTETRDHSTGDIRDSLCGSCHLQMETTVYDWKIDFWQRLPSMFRL
ncbi:hypothetical protein SCP_0205430 [Sparassis crispa]|uniref:BTB domain-containing protein n=1 Tax=Sparassis crispa TaxID=139825 RepID=A0A401GB03_9APHY|nr:hypothetical protein SCP_0205430 [Sparassis crispa]GBE79345.1 hypothetical protein SCP_0205430 [Sparassis crispa]